jgi:hypothetical protein
MACIGAALATNHDLVTATEQIDDLPLALVTPLQTQNSDIPVHISPSPESGMQDAREYDFARCESRADASAQRFHSRGDQWREKRLLLSKCPGKNQDESYIPEHEKNDPTMFSVPHDAFGCRRHSSSRGTNGRKKREFCILTHVDL